MLRRPSLGERGAIPAHARGRDAVEQVDAAPDSLDEVLGKADPHQVARPIARERLAHHVEDLVHRGFFLADGKAADSETLPVVHVCKRASGFASQVRVDSALDYREERLRFGWLRVQSA